MTGQERDELIELFKAQPSRCMQLAYLIGVDPEDERLLDDYMDGRMLHKEDRRAVESYIIKAASVLRDEQQ